LDLENLHSEGEVPDNGGLSDVLSDIGLSESHASSGQSETIGNNVVAGHLVKMTSALNILAVSSISHVVISSLTCKS
jgi:hypothetical protein